LVELFQSRPALAPGPCTLRRDDAIVRYEASHDSMGTTFAVAAYGPDRKYLAAVINEVFEEIDRLDRQMSKYRPDSELSYINRNAARSNVLVEPRLFGLIRDCIRYSSETEAAFDITIGPLMKSWGFFQQGGRVPAETERAQILNRTGYQHVKLDATARTVRFDENGVELDLGGIGKGYAIDQAVEILRSNAVTSALVSSGMSSIYALGAPPQERAWTISLRDPSDAEKVADVILLKNCSLSTSGNYVNFFKLNGRTYSHIMDPVGGRPVEQMLSASVLALKTTDSEALSTAFYVMGPERGRQYLAEHPNLTVLHYQPEGSTVAFKRVAARSNSYGLPPDVVAEVQQQ
jgi:FAD:protein FMN transferase